MKSLPLILLTLSAAQAFAANPFLPSWEYIPDGEPRVFGDRVYLYGSHDKAGSDSFCDFQLRVWSAPLDDLNTWTDHGVSFSTRNIEGHKDDVPWSDNQLYAPDVVENNGKYYLYAYIVGSPAAVAISDTPTGPFKFVSQIIAPPGAPNDFGGWSQYADPGVLVDDDGKVYLYWGYLRSYMAQLNPDNMYEILPDTFQTDIVPTEAPYNYFEAPSPRKIGDTYYLIYADGGILTYTTSDSPTGPFAYGGPINRNGTDYPGGNNHGSLANLNGLWYIFYHRMTHGTITSRKACVEKITINPDGSIDEVGQTSLGFETALDPFTYRGAESACVITGGANIYEEARDQHPVNNNRNNSVVGYKYFDFGSYQGSETMSLSAKLRLTAGQGAVEIWLDSTNPATGTKLGEHSLPTDPATIDQWTSLQAILPNVTGEHALYFRFTGNSAYRCDLLSFGFQKHGPIPPAHLAYSPESDQLVISFENATGTTPQTLLQSKDLQQWSPVQQAYHDSQKVRTWTLPTTDAETSFWKAGPPETTQ